MIVVIRETDISLYEIL